jgi:large subunit ribosomal protein L16
MHFKQHKTLKNKIGVPLDLVNYENLPSVNSMKTSALAQLNLTLKKQNKVIYGEVGLEALENGYLDQKQIESTRRYLARFVKREGKLWIRVFPDQSLTKRAKDTRMGAGKGDIDTWVAAVKTGRIIFEISGVAGSKAAAALQAASYKLPIKTKLKMCSGKKFIHATFKGTHLKQPTLKQKFRQQTWLPYHGEKQENIRDEALLLKYAKKDSSHSTTSSLVERNAAYVGVPEYDFRLTPGTGWTSTTTVRPINESDQTESAWRSGAARDRQTPPETRKTENNTNEAAKSVSKSPKPIYKTTPKNFVVMSSGPQKTWLKSWDFNEKIDRHSLPFSTYSTAKTANFLITQNISDSSSSTNPGLRSESVAFSEFERFKIFSSKDVVETTNFRKKKTKWLKHSFRLWKTENINYY